MRYVVLDITATGIDVSDGYIPQDWQMRLVNAGCAGHVPLERYGNVMVVYDCDVALLGVPENAVVYRTDSDEEFIVWRDSQEAGE